MRKLILIATGTLLTVSSFAQDFHTVMQKTFVTFDTTKNPDQSMEYANKLVLIAKKFDKDWQASYYAAYSKVLLSYREQDGGKKDAILDEAQAFIEQSVAILGKDNDETHVIRAMIASSRIGVDAQNRWQKYGKVFSENLDKAKEINPNNPRIYMQLGMNKYFTPAMFGGGKKAALPYLEKAKELYDKEAGGDVLKPYWGREFTMHFLGLANGTIKEDEKKS
jgi:tetratricopeptide (TPR) repeat protein